MGLWEKLPKWSSFTACLGSPLGTGLEPLLICLESSQLRWFSHLIRMHPGCVPVQAFWACPNVRKPRRGHTLVALHILCRLGMPLYPLERAGGHCCMYGEKLTPATQEKHLHPLRRHRQCILLHCSLTSSHSCHDSSYVELVVLLYCRHRVKGQW